MYKRILVAIDGSATSKRGLEEAIRLANATGGKLMLVHVVDEFMTADYAPSVYYDRVVVSLRQAGVETLEDAAAIVRRADVPFEQKLVESFGARPADGIVKEATEWQADLIALGTHGRRGLKRLALGSDAELVLRQSPVPVLIVRDQPEVRGAVEQS
jgi:nucleotide-binding universal stress UspA family protein